jgi:hypothetical protein
MTTRLVHAALVTALAVGCGGEPPGRQEFLSTYCGLLSPCCARAHRPSLDGARCEAFLDAVTPRAAYDPHAGERCLAGVRAAAARSDYCQIPDPDDAPACQPLFARRLPAGAGAPGERCDSDDDCAPSDEGAVSCAQVFGVAAVTRRCQLEIRGREGDGPCVTGGDPVIVFPYPPSLLAGSFASSVVQSFPRNTQPAARAYRCDRAQGLRCANDGSRCVRLADAGQSCDLPNDCVPEATCPVAGGQCRPRVALGAPCDPASVRVQFLCVQGAWCEPRGRTCQAQVPVGGPCQQDSQCQTGVCINGGCDVSDAAALAAAALFGHE